MSPSEECGIRLLPASGSSLRSAHGTLLTITDELLLHAPWPLPPNAVATFIVFCDNWRQCELRAFDMNCGVQLTVDVSMPFRIPTTLRGSDYPGEGAEARCEHAEATASDGESGSETFDIGAALEELREGGASGDDGGAVGCM